MIYEEIKKQINIIKAKDILGIKMIDKNIMGFRDYYEELKPFYILNG